MLLFLLRYETGATETAAALKLLLQPDAPVPPPGPDASPPDDKDNKASATTPPFGSPR